TPSLGPDGVRGPMIYGGQGELKALDGQPVQGSVVLLDFACGQNYLHAASLGAKAIVFFDNGGVNREQAADKFLKVPVDIPRFWLERQDALDLVARLQDGPVAVHLNARMDWEGVEAHNVYGYLPGSPEMLPAKSREKPQVWQDQTIHLGRAGPRPRSGERSRDRRSAPASGTAQRISPALLGALFGDLWAL
ncbi:MAG: hypothetical protein J4F35_03580, partial [Candidatus Latescibacteria bacterium]|nr:hypothetical protein [Candidatus Latescibacterota bacterium]